MFPGRGSRHRRRPSRWRSWAAQRQPTLAPDLKLTGVALGGVVGDIKETLLSFNGGPAGGAVPVGLSGVDRSYPQTNVLRYLNAAGRKTVAAASHDCIADGIARYPFWSLAQYGARPGVIDEPAPTSFLAGISPASMTTVPSGPVNLYTTLDDEFAPLDAAQWLAARYCGAGVRVDQVTDPPSDHVGEAALGAPAAMGYLADRFADKPAPTTC